MPPTAPKLWTSDVGGSDGRLTHQSKLTVPRTEPTTKKKQRNQHARIAAAGRKERAGSASAAELHADAEHEGAGEYAETRRRDGALHLVAEKRAACEEREEQNHGDGKQDHLHAKPAPAPVHDEARATQT